MASLSSLRRRARRRYIKNPTRATLRLYLIYKARSGKFDRRMFSYYGVNPHVNAGCRAAVVRAYAEGLVPTSTLRSGSGGSFHNQRNAQGEGLAVDFGVIERHIGTEYGEAKLREFQRKEHWRHRQGKLRHDLVELIGPDNELTVLRDRETNLAEGTALEQQHDNHVHEAFRG